MDAQFLNKCFSKRDKNKVTRDSCKSCKAKKIIFAYSTTLLFVSLFFFTTLSHAQQYSPDFLALLTKIQQTYLRQGETIQLIQQGNSINMAIILGHAMRQQQRFAQQNFAFNSRFQQMSNDARTFIQSTARMAHNRAPGFGYMPWNRLWNTYYMQALNGRYDDWIGNTYGVQTGKMTSVFAGPGQGLDTKEHYLYAPSSAPPTKDGSMNLLGVPAPGDTRTPIERAREACYQYKISPCCANYGPDGNPVSVYQCW